MNRPVLLATLEYPPQIGGVAEYLRRLVETFPPGAAQVLAPDDPSAHESDMRSPAPIYRRPLLWRNLRPRWLPAVYWTDWLCRKERPSLIIVSHLLPMGTVARLIARRRRLPYAVIVHGMDAALAAHAGGAKRDEAGRVLQGAAFIVANSSYTARLVESLGAAREKITVVRPAPGFPLSTSADPAKIEEIRRRYGLDGAFSMLSVGRLVKRKGYDAGIEALAALKEQGVPARYLIVGDGPERRALERSAKESGVAGEVRFAGAVPQEELPAVYAACDVFVLTPRSIGPDVEGFGIVYLEANLMGKPVIGSRSGGVTDAVVHGKTGFLIDPRKPAELAAALLRLHGDADLRRRLGEEGRRRVLDEFDGGRQFGRLAAELCAEKARAAARL